MKFTQHDKNSLIKRIKDDLAYAEKMPVTKSCMDCVNADFLVSGAFCKLARMIPPKDVVDLGCTHHIFNPESIPF